MRDGSIVEGSFDCCLYNSFCLSKNIPKEGLRSSFINAEILWILLETIEIKMAINQVLSTSNIGLFRAYAETYNILRISN